MGSRVRLALFALSLGILTLTNDLTAMNVAIPSIERDFGTGVSTTQWVINAYSLVFGVLIVTGGKLADLLGRKKVFLYGSLIFAAASAVGGLSPTESWLIGSRAVMGVGAAMMWPAILGLAYGTVPAEKVGLAGGLILAMAGLGNAIGPLLGGFLTDELSWRWILYANVPITLTAVLISMRLVNEPHREIERERFDLAGTVLLTFGLVIFMLALDQVVDLGWSDPVIILGLVLAVTVIASFARLESRIGSRALVPGNLMTRRFTGACLAVLAISATFFSVLFYLPRYMQLDFGYSALESGLGMLPFIAVFAVVSYLSGPLFERIGAKRTTGWGAATILIGIAAIAAGVSTDGTLTGIVPGMVVLGVGVGLFYPAITTAAITSVDDSQSSLAGGTLYMFQIAGGSVGLAMTTTVFAAQSGLVPGLRAGFGFNALMVLIGLLLVLTMTGTGDDRKDRIPGREDGPATADQSSR